MKSLVITAHPNPKGFTHRIAETYRMKQEKQGHEVEILNLYTSEFKQDFLMLGEDNKALPDSHRDVMQQKISRADELVFVFPVWRFDCPAIIKNFVDTNFTSGFAFRYLKGGKVEKLLTGKTAKIFLTTGAPRHIYVLALLFPIWLMWKFGRLGYCGINLTKIKAFNGLPGIRDEKIREKLLEEVK